MIGIKIEEELAMATINMVRSKKEKGWPVFHKGIHSPMLCWWSFIKDTESVAKIEITSDRLKPSRRPLQTKVESIG